MAGRILRVLLGFILGAFGAGLTKVLFAFTPSQIANWPSDVFGDRLASLLLSSLFAAAHMAVFAAPFALLAAAIAEWRRVRDWEYFALAGMGISLLGFLAQYSAEFTGQETLVNNYAITAFLSAGFVAGIIYWLISGRFAGGPIAANTMKSAMTNARPTSANGKPGSGSMSKPAGTPPPRRT